MNLRTSRLIAELKETSIADAIKIASYPSESKEQATTKFIEAVTASNSLSPLDMTVAERTFLVTFYLGHVSEEGADFRIGNNTLSDYIHYDKEYSPAPATEYTLSDDVWTVNHLTGRYAESIERTLGHIDIPAGLHWDAGVMAAQMRNQDDTESVSDETLDDWMIARIKAILAFPESKYYELQAIYGLACGELLHLLDPMVDIVEGGLNYHPVEATIKEVGGKKDLSPARFPCISCIGSRTKALYQVLN